MTSINMCIGVLLLAVVIHSPSEDKLTLVVHNSTNGAYEVRGLTAIESDSCNACIGCNQSFAQWKSAPAEWATVLSSNSFNGIDNERPFLLGLELRAGKSIYRIYCNAECGATSGFFMDNGEKRTVRFTDDCRVRIE